MSHCAVGERVPGGSAGGGASRGGGVPGGGVQLMTSAPGFQPKVNFCTSLIPAGPMPLLPPSRKTHWNAAFYPGGFPRCFWFLSSKHRRRPRLHASCEVSSSYGEDKRKGQNTHSNPCPSIFSSSFQTGSTAQRDKCPLDQRYGFPSRTWQRIYSRAEASHRSLRSFSGGTVAAMMMFTCGNGGRGGLLFWATFCRTICAKTKGICFCSCILEGTRSTPKNVADLNEPSVALRSLYLSVYVLIYLYRDILVQPFTRASVVGHSVISLIVVNVYGQQLACPPLPLQRRRTSQGNDRTFLETISWPSRPSRQS